MRTVLQISQCHLYLFSLSAVIKSKSRMWLLLLRAYIHIINIYLQRNLVCIQGPLNTRQIFLDRLPNPLEVGLAEETADQAGSERERGGGRLYCHSRTALSLCGWSWSIEPPRPTRGPEKPATPSKNKADDFERWIASISASGVHWIFILKNYNIFQSNNMHYI